MNRFRPPSSALIVALLALSLSLGGVAWALTSGSVKSKHIAKNAVADKHLRDFTTIGMKKLSPTASNANSNAARAAADKVSLFKSGDFKIYAKCFVGTGSPDNPYVQVGVYLKAPAATVFGSDEDDTSNGELGSGVPEDERELFTQGSSAGVGNPGTLNIPDADDNAFFAAAGKRFIEGTIVAASKVGNPDAGNGPFGSGNKCLVFGTVRSG